jgi:hypothetical protein
MAKVRLWPLLLPVGLWAQGDPTTCPYLRYILFDACPAGNEGNDELLIFYTPVAFNINNLRIDFPNPAGTVWCYTDCGVNNFTCTSTNNTVAYLNANACAGTTFTCPAAGTTIPANSFILLFTGNNVTNNYPNPSALCGAGTVYVLFVNQNIGGTGRYLNNPTSNQNRRTIITFTGAPACNMTVNYRGSISGADGNYLLVDPNICIGLTSGANANDGTQPPPGSCAYRGPGGGGPSNGVSLGNIGANCDLPSIGVLPILWQEVRVVGGRLRWRALFEGEAERPLTLWHQPEEQATAYIYRGGLGAKGELPLERAGLYYLTVESADGTRVRSPGVWYEGDARPYIRYEGGRPILERSGEVAELRVWDMSGRLVLSAAAPVEREVLSRLGGYGRGVYNLLLHLRSGEVLQERLLVEP